jgi:hypothetical protein
MEAIVFSNSATKFILNVHRGPCNTSAINLVTPPQKSMEEHTLLTISKGAGDTNPNRPEGGLLLEPKQKQEIKQKQKPETQTPHENEQKLPNPTCQARRSLLPSALKRSAAPAPVKRARFTASIESAHHRANKALPGTPGSFTTPTLPQQVELATRKPNPTTHNLLSWV